jgi:DNA-binding GntR family transcriptional regulator
MSGERSEADTPDEALRGETVPRGEFVQKALVQAIRDGRLRPGERCREETVAKMFGVSRTPVREALQRLLARGLLSVVPELGGIVVTRLSRQQVLEVYAMREILEGASARFAAQFAQLAEVDLMRTLMAEFAVAEADAAKLARINTRLHRLICEAARNRYVEEGLNNLGDVLSLLSKTTFEVEGRFALAVGEHEAIVDAIERRDSDAAEAAARHHIRCAQAARMRLLLED